MFNRRRRKAIKAVVDAWTIEGPDPTQHREWQNKLRQPLPDGWPTLANAVEELVAAFGR